MQQIDILQKELKFLIELRHPSIVHLMGLSVHSEHRCSIVMEIMGCDLRRVIDLRMRKRNKRVGSVMFRKWNKTVGPGVGGDFRQDNVLQKWNETAGPGMDTDLLQHINLRKRKRKTEPVEPGLVVPFDLHEAVYIITRIALGMAFLHSRGVAHRDLKAANVLVPEHSGSLDVKLADFGVSQLIDPSEKPLRGVGTGFWVAPEMFQLKRSEYVGDQPMSYDLKAADVYSFAMTCYEVLTGGVPLEDQIYVYGWPAAMRLAVIEGLRPVLPSDLNSDLRLLIEECWPRKPEKRPTFSRICQILQKIQQRLQSSTS